MMKLPPAIIFLFLLLLISGSDTPPDNQATQPNVLFIAIDDMNDWSTLFDEANPIQTPFLKSFTEKSFFFNHAYSVSPACNPSRVAVLTGLRPYHSGIYKNEANWKEQLPNHITLPHYFKRNGYYVFGTGKIYHENMFGQHYDTSAWHAFHAMDNPPDGPFPSPRLNGIRHWIGGRDNGAINGLFDWGAKQYSADHLHPDQETVRRIKDEIAEVKEPFFLAAGILRPHMPYYAPQEYFDLYPLDSITLPVYYPDDLADLPSGAMNMLENAKPFIYETIVHSAEDSINLKKALQAYYACATFADAQVGELLDALRESPYADNTIVVIWSDHGYHLGEKQHWEKFALWEKTNRVPFLIKVPGIASQDAGPNTTPIDLIHLYPTLADLCNLPEPENIDGESFAPLLKGKAWHLPALMTYGEGNHAIKTHQYRYISYQDGTEELYDHRTDPYEWYNLAENDNYQAVKDSLSQWLPSPEKPSTY